MLTARLAACCAAANQGAQSTIDFSGLLGVIIIEANAELSWNALILRNYAPQRVARDAARLARRNIMYEVQGYGAWPTILVAPGAEVRPCRAALG